MKSSRQPSQLLTPLPKDTTEKGLIYLFVLSCLLILLYGYLLINEKVIPPFLTGLMGFTISPLVYTIMPKFLQIMSKFVEK